MVKNINIHTKFIKTSANLLIITLVLLNYCTLCFVYWHKDYKLLLHTLNVTKANASFNVASEMAYANIKDMEKAPTKVKVKIDGKVILFEEKTNRKGWYIIDSKDKNIGLRVKYFN